MRCCAAALSRVPFRTRPKQEAAILSHIFVGVGSHHFLKLSSVLRKHPVVPKSGKGLISQDWVWMSQKGCNVILQHRVTKLAEVMDCTSKCRYGSNFLARDLDFLRDEMLVSLSIDLVFHGASHRSACLLWIINPPYSRDLSRLVVLEVFLRITVFPQLCLEGCSNLSRLRVTLPH